MIDTILSIQTAPVTGDRQYTFRSGRVSHCWPTIHNLKSYIFLLINFKQFRDHKRMYLNIAYKKFNQIIKTQYTQKWLFFAGFTKCYNFFCHLFGSISSKPCCILFVAFFTISSNFRHSSSSLSKFMTRYLGYIYLTERIPQYMVTDCDKYKQEILKYIWSIRCRLIATLNKSLAACRWNRLTRPKRKEKQNRRGA